MPELIFVTEIDNTYGATVDVVDTDETGLDALGVAHRDCNRALDDGISAMVVIADVPELHLSSKSGHYYRRYLTGRDTWLKDRPFPKEPRSKGRNA